MPRLPASQPASHSATPSYGRRESRQTKVCAVVGCVLAFTLVQAPAIYAQKPQLELQVLFLVNPVSAEPARLWMAIKNIGQVPRVLCRSRWSYSWISDDPTVEAFINAKASLHGCGDDDHDPMWILLPGETRFDSFGVKAPPEEKVRLRVSIDIEMRDVDSGSSTETTLEWHGLVREAVANGVKVRSNATK